MFKTVKRIIDWCGEFKGRLYAGFVVSFFSHLFTALPIMLAAYTIGLLLQSAMDGTPFDTGWVWKSLAHRLSTITDAANIAVVQDGRVAAQGTHAQLLQSSPLYREMWQAHMGAKEGDAE